MSTVTFVAGVAGQDMGDCSDITCASVPVCGLKCEGRYLTQCGFIAVDELDGTEKESKRKTALTTPTMQTKQKLAAPGVVPKFCVDWRDL